jgi:hypothetical protein
VLTEASGAPREVKEINGEYGIFDHNGKLIDKYPSRLALMAGAKTAMDSDPTAGITLAMNVQKEAREQLTASSNIQRAAAESTMLTSQAKELDARNKREGIKSAHEDIDWQRAYDTDKFLANPDNRVLHPAEWAAAAQYQVQLHPHLMTSTQSYDEKNGVALRTPVNMADQMGDQYQAAIAKDKLVQANKIAVAPINGVPHYALQMKNGKVMSFDKFDEAAQAGRAEYPEIYGHAAPAAGAPGGRGGKGVRGIGLGGGPPAKPAAAAPAAPAAPAAAPKPAAPAAPAKPLTQPEINVKTAQGYISAPGRAAKHAQDLALLQRFDSRPKGSSASGLDSMVAGAARSRVAEYTRQQAVIAAGGKPQAGR